MLFCRAALPSSRTTLGYVSGVTRPPNIGTKSRAGPCAGFHKPSLRKRLPVADTTDTSCHAADKVCPLFLIAVAARSSRFRGDALCKISQSASAETPPILICMPRTGSGTWRTAGPRRAAWCRCWHRHRPARLRRTCGSSPSACTGVRPGPCLGPQRLTSEPSGQNWMTADCPAAPTLHARVGVQA